MSSAQLLGFAWDASSSHARGAALAPSLIHSLLHSPASSPYSISGIDARQCIASFHVPAMPENAAAARSLIQSTVSQCLHSKHAPLSLGGDHSISYPILLAMKEHYGRVTVLHIDAHPDLYQELDGDRYSHACPFARAIEDQCIDQLVQVGIRSATPEQRRFAADHGVIMLGADELANIPYEKLQHPLYVSIDLDGLDPAYAPGVSHPEPGGLSTREVLAVLKRLPTAPVGADIVEYNPERDQQMQTGHVAARLVKELAALLST